MSKRRHPLSTAEVILLGVAIAAGLLGLGRAAAPGVAEATLPPRWTEPVGAAISVPACASSGTSVTCQNGRPLVTLNWQLDNSHGCERGAEVSITNGPTWTNQPPSGSLEWSGANSNQSYGYQVSYFADFNPRVSCGSSGTGGTFVTPACVPLSASCSVSPASAATGQSVTWAASSSGGSSPTKLLLHMDGPDGSASFSDVSGAGHSVTANGNARVSTAQSKFGGASMYVTSGWLSISNNADFNFSGNFTMDFWMRHTGAGSWSAVWGSGSGGADTADLIIDSTASYIRGINLRSILAQANGNFWDNTWHHVAFVRAGTTNTIYIDGISRGSANTSYTMSDDGAPQTIGNSNDDGGWRRQFTGYIDEFRVSNGLARWTSNFIPPTSAYTGNEDHTYSWSGTDGLSGSGQSVQKSYSSAGIKTGSVTVTLGSRQTSTSCSNSVSVAQANQPPNPPGGSGGGGGGGGGSAGTPLAAGGGISVPPTAGAGGVNSGTPAFGESPAGACTNPLRPTFTWTYSDPDGDPQGWFELEADNNSNFSSPEIDTGQSAGAVTSYLAPAGSLVYNTTYHWRVRVWDNRGAVSEWSNGTSFSTQPHQAPTVVYTWAPTEPAVDQRTNFTDQSSVFGGASKRAWTWAFPDGAPSSSSSQNQQTQFTSTGGKLTSLILEDSDRLSCGLRQSVTVSGAFGAPAWREVIPE